MDLKSKFIFLLGLMLMVLSNLVHAQELKVLEHIPNEKVGKGYNLAISPDGKFIAFQDLKSLTVSVMDLETKEIIAELKDAGRILYLTFTPDSKSLAMYLVHEPIIKIWNFKETISAKRVLTLQLPEKAPLDANHPFVFSPDGKYLVTASGGIDLLRRAVRGEQITEADLEKALKRWIYLLDAKEGKIVKVLESPIPYGEERSPDVQVNGLAFSPDSRYLVSRCGRRLSVWDLYEEVISEEAKRLMIERAKARFREKINGPPDPAWDPLLDPELRKLVKEKRFTELKLSPYLLLKYITNASSSPKSPLFFSSDGKYLINPERGAVYRYDFTPKEWKEWLELANMLSDVLIELFIYGPVKGALPGEYREAWRPILEKFCDKLKEDLKSLQASIPVKDFNIPPYKGNWLYQSVSSGNLIAIGTRGEVRPGGEIHPGLLVTVDALKEVARFTTNKLPENKRFDFTGLLHIFPDGKRLFTYNDREGIYIFDISTLKK